jgi:mono/diheme cytochrome c family protein
VLRHDDDMDFENQGSGVPNYLGPVVISPDGLSGWVPSKKDNVKRGTLRSGGNLNFQNTVRSISSRIDLSTDSETFGARIDHDNASLASAAAFDRYGVILFVALETSREVAVVDAHNHEEFFRISVGRAPQGLAVSPDGLRLYVHNFMDRTVGVYDLTALVNEGQWDVPLLETLQTVATESLDATVLKGKQLFYDARDSRLAREGYMSCASCHNDGGGDGRVWDLTGMDEGLRNTISLRGRGGAHGFLHWSGNFDEVQDFEGQIRALAGGTGLLPDALLNQGTRSQTLGDPKAGLSADLDALAAYVASLDSFAPSPHRNGDGSLTADGVAGRAIFQSLNCAECHGGTSFTTSGAATLSDIGTLRQPGSGQRLGGVLAGIDPPTLRGVWATPPYLHDGRAATLEAAVRAHSGVTISDADLGKLVAYLEQIDGSEPAPPASPPPNGPPVVSNPGAQSGTVGTAVSLQVSASDPDGDPLTFAASGLPPGLSIGAGSGLITGLPTAAGSFDVTVQASDAETSGSASFGWTITDAGAPTVTIAAPTAAATHATGTSPLTLGGTATDNVAVTQVSWSNDRGSSGTATGTATWTASGIVLQSGQNVLTVTARDATGNTGTDVLTVTYTPPDTTAPVVTITSPTSAASFATGATPLSLGGTATDAVGVTLVTWSNDRGGSGTAAGASIWSVDGIALASGANVLTVTARDAAGNTSTDTLMVTYSAPQPTCTACTIFEPTAVPSVISDTDTGSVNLGVKFRAEIAGYVTGIRFYKGPQNLGTHVGSLWSSTGTLLASATFTNETASGWQQVNFAAPVPIQANTVYVASYLAPQGRYSGDNDYFANAAVTRGVLQALQQGTSGGNGVYRYGASNAFPDASWRSSNYWVDVVFSSDGTPPPDATAPSVTVTAPTSAATFATSATPLSVGGSAADNVGVTQVTWSNDRGGSGTATGTTSWTVNGIALTTGANVITVTARDAAGNSGTDTLTVTYSAPVADTTAPTVTITSPTNAATFATSAASLSLGGSAADNVGVTQVTWSNDRGGSGTASGTTSWTASGIALQSGVNQLTVTARDAAGNTATDVLSVSYDAGAPCSGCSLWPGSATPALASSPDTGAVNLGVKFRSDVAGRVTGVRFYKGPGNTGTHVGSLWSAGGTLLASATFSNETASGWQQVNFASPVNITADTTYVVSYHAPNGGYAFNPSYFSSSGVDNGVLHAPANAAAGGNGVYRYASSSAFPNASYNASNYWVDVVFDSTPAVPDTTAPAVTITTPTGATTYETGTSPLNLGGAASDNVGVTQVTWSNDRGGSGTATGTSNWTANGIALVSGVNTLTVTVRDAAGNTGTDTLLVTYTPPVVDTTPPAVTIIAPTSAATFTATASPLALGGTASDNVGVTQVTWTNDRGGSGTAAGNGNWTVGGIPLASGDNVITVTARDAAGNTATDTLTVSYQGAPACIECSLWDAAATPSLASSPDTGAVNLGVKFRADVAGRVMGARFYKGTANTGTHVASLWTAGGTLLAQATFTNETASGWQRVDFPNPVAIQANTTYVVSYHAPNGRYAFDGAYFASTSVAAGPLQAPATAAAGGNGVYRYGASSAFPDASYNASNYWVDVVFSSD